MISIQCRRILASFGWVLFARVAPVVAQAPVTAFVDVAVVPMDRERVLLHQTVVAQGDHIVALGSVKDISVPSGAVRVDGRGKFLMPGLADMHVHFYDGNGHLETDMDVADLLFSYVANGVTTVRDMHSGNPLVDPWMASLRQRIASGQVLGPHIYAAGDADQSSAEAATKSIEAMKAAGYEFVKLYGFRRPQYDWIVSAAHRSGVRVVGHVPGNVMGDKSEDSLFAGLSGVMHDRWASAEHLFGYVEAATGQSYLSLNSALPPPVSDATFRRLARETAQADLWNCPTLTMKWAAGLSFFDDSVRPWVIQFNQRLIRALHDAGAGLLLGTDGGATTADDNPMLLGGFAMHRELELLVEAGLTPYQALETGTRNVARFLGTLDSTGTVTVGKRADLVLLKANPLADVHHVTALAGVMVGGRWLSRADLDQRIDSLRSAPDTGGANDAEKNRKNELSAVKWGSVPARIRVLSRVIWR